MSITGIRIGSDELGSVGPRTVDCVCPSCVVASVGGGGAINREGNDRDERTVAAHK